MRVEAKPRNSGAKVAHVATLDISLRYLLLNQLRSIRAEGYEVVCVSSVTPLGKSMGPIGFKHMEVPMTRRISPLADLVSLVRLFRAFRRERLVIVHTHNPKPGLLGQVAARLAGVPIVVNTLHGFYFHDGTDPMLRSFLIWMERIAARCSDVILSQNREDIETAVKEGICPRERITFLGNGIDIERFRRDNVRNEQLDRNRQALGLANTSPVVGFVGRLVAEKGILELFRAAEIVRHAVPAVRFVVVGPIDSAKPDAISDADAQRIGVADLLTFTGMREDVEALYPLMDVFVLPSHREGFPRAPMEASAMGVPCIVTDIRGCREVVEHGRNGLLVPLGDVNALAEAIIDLLEDTEKAQRMGREGRKIAEERFDERIVFAKVKAEYRRLLREKGLPAPGVQVPVSVAD